MCAILPSPRLELSAQISRDGTRSPSTQLRPPAAKRPETDLLHVLLKHTELQPLVQSDLAVLPDVLQLPLVVQHLVDDVKDVVHGLGVVGRGCQGIGAAGGQRPLELVEERLPVLAHLPTKQGAISQGPPLYPGRDPGSACGDMGPRTHTTHTHTHTQIELKF